MNHILAVCDSETEYAYRLADYLNTRKGFPFAVQVFTSIESLCEFADKYPLTLALVSQKDCEQYEGRLPVEHLVLLGEEKEREDSGFVCFWKYQSCEALVKELLEWIAGEEILGRPTQTGRQMKLIGVYSPVGKCLKTSFSFVLGQLLSKKNRVLYLNLETYSGLGSLLKREFSTDLAELLYFLQNTPDRFAYRLGGMVERIGGLDILPPVRSYLDLVSVSREEWIKLLKAIEKKSDYEYVILDLSDGVQGIYDVLRLCNLIYTLGREDGVALAKIEQYKTVLTRSSYEDLWQKTKQYTIPAMTNLPTDLLALTFTELAEFVRERIKEDLDD